MLDRLTQSLTTPHLAKLLATYEVPKDSDNSGSQDYFLVFECADSTLSDLWTKPPADWIELPQVAKWVASQSQGLAAALGMIHDFKKYRALDDFNDRTHGFYGDLKPDNVLCYKNWIGQEHELGILQITDFGLSSFHHTQTAVDIKIRHQAGDYRPPESQMVLKISVSFDVWTLGCLSLEFLTWLVKGPSGLKEFRESRLSRGFTYAKHTCFWEVTEENDFTIVSLSKAILQVSQIPCLLSMTCCSRWDQVNISERV
jgi:serine/threonine protein kinase